MLMHGTLDKYKAQLVVQGFSQVESFDYGETFFLVINIIYLCIFIPLVVIYIK
jgi:hypothetical protein